MARTEPVESGLSTNGIGFGGALLGDIGEMLKTARRVAQKMAKVVYFCVHSWSLVTMKEYLPVGLISESFNVTDWEKILDADACIFTNRMLSTAL